MAKTNLTKPMYISDHTGENKTTYSSYQSLILNNWQQLEKVYIDNCENFDIVRVLNLMAVNWGQSTSILFGAIGDFDQDYIQKYLADVLR